MTQMESARAGKITEEMEIAARKEGVSAEYIRAGVAEGTIVIPKNKNRRRSNICAIGKGLSVKVNALIGTSNDRAQRDMEAGKLRIAEEAGCDSFMDLSTGGDIDEMRRQTLRLANVAVGCVPLYQAGVNAIKKDGGVVNMKPDDLFDIIEQQAADGMDFMAIHSALSMDIIETLRRTGRVTEIVSRGGSFMTAWMLHNQRENPLYEQFDRLLDIMRRHDVTLSIGDAVRPGCTADSLDAIQLKGLILAGELAKRALDAGVQVMIEGPGHVPLNHIESTLLLQKRLCHDVPYFILGFLSTDIAPGYDNITAAIGGAWAGLHGADFICYLTPAEHLGLPNEEDVRTGVISAKIAANAADVSRKRNGAWERALEMSKARAALDVNRQIELAMYPDRLSAAGHDGGKCEVCGEKCACQIAAEYFGAA
ncbi:phosphomethylpyrimidine synthase 2 [Synergistales bacterium]|nr:phosphomethylpyrimidine synthase 2 [Synergistales bacterium]